MKKLNFLLCLASLIPVAYKAGAEVRLPITSKVRVKVIDAIAIEHNASDLLNFGTIVASDDHVVSIDAGGNRTGTKRGQLVADENTPTADSFTIITAAARQVDLDVEAPQTLDEGSKLSPTLNTSPAPTAGKLSLGQNANVLHVYGDLAVTAGATAGDYEQNYTVTVRY